MNELSQPELALYVNVAVCLAFTVIWLVVAVFTAFRYVRSTKDGEKAVFGALVFWIVTVAGIFTGPCIIFFAVLGVFVAGFRLARLKDMNAPTRAATVATLAHSAVMLLMMLASIAVLAWGGFFG